jgi:hypothetical protein
VFLFPFCVHFSFLVLDIVRSLCVFMKFGSSGLTCGVVPASVRPAYSSQGIKYFSWSRKGEVKLATSVTEECKSVLRFETHTFLNPALLWRKSCLSCNEKWRYAHKASGSHLILFFFLPIRLISKLRKIYGVMSVCPSL